MSDGDPGEDPAVSCAQARHECINAEGKKNCFGTIFSVTEGWNNVNGSFRNFPAPPPTLRKLINASHSLVKNYINWNRTEIFPIFKCLMLHIFYTSRSRYHGNNRVNHHDIRFRFSPILPPATHLTSAGRSPYPMHPGRTSFALADINQKFVCLFVCLFIRQYPKLTRLCSPCRFPKTIICNRTILLVY